VVQEALTNAAKYGLGTAAVLLKEEAGMLRIEVSNPVAASAPGVGPASGGPEPEHATGHGLLGMRERVAAAGGTIVVTPGATFRVAVQLPLQRAG
jgi:signal transduction histidine kinase